MTPPCGHDPPQPDTCLICCLAEAIPADVEPTPENLEARIKLNCIHIGKVVDYKNCGCPMKHVHLCDLHNRVTLHDCQSCTDYILDEACGD